MAQKIAIWDDADGQLKASTTLISNVVGTLTDSHIYVGNSSNVPTDVAMSGDITINNTGVTAIGTNKVLDTMLRQGGALSVIGRSANSTGNVADISAGTDNFVLRRSGTSLGFGLLVNANIDSAAAIDFSKLAALTSTNILVGSAGNVATSVTVTGDVTIGNTGVTAIGTNKVLDTMIRQSSGLSVVGRSANTTGNVADITAGTDNFVLRRSGTSIGFGLLVNANIDSAAAIAITKLANGTANQLIGANSGATANEFKTLATGTSGTDFAIAHTTNTITFNIPDASGSNRGLVTTGTQTFAGAKTFSTSVTTSTINMSSGSSDANIKHGGTAGRLVLDGDSGGAGGEITLYGSTHATQAGKIIAGATAYTFSNTSGTQRFAIDSNGNGIFNVAVSIGFGSAPTSGYQLDIQNTQAQIRAESTTGTNRAFFAAVNTGGPALFGIDSSTGGSIASGSSAYATVVGSGGARNLELATNNSIKMWILSGGNVGIGVSPSNKLDVYAAQNGGTVLRISANAIGGTNADAAMDFGANNGTTVTYGRIGLSVATASAGSETGSLFFSTINNGSFSAKMTLGANGGLGIGVVPQAGYMLKTQSSTSDATINRHIQFVPGGGSATTYLGTTTTTSVTSSATVILSLELNATWVYIAGTDGSNSFADLVVTSQAGTPTTISSYTVAGSPAARTYSTNSSNLRVAMGSGTYTVSAYCTQMSFR